MESPSHAVHRALQFRAPAWACLAALWLGGPAIHAEIFFLRGKVVMQDGSPPPGAAAIERICGKAAPQKQASTDRKGQFLLRIIDKDVMADVANSSGILETQTGETGWMAINQPLDAQCRIRASLPGYESNSFNLAEVGWTNNPDLPALTLYAKGSAALVDITQTQPPIDAQAAWAMAIKAIQVKNWSEAERELRSAVAKSPKFAGGWNTLAAVYRNQKNLPAERDAYQHAIAAQPKSSEPYLSLMRLEMSAQEWEAADKVAESLFKADPTHSHPDAYADRAVILYRLKDVDGATAAAREALRLDPNHQWPRSEYILGTLLEAKADFAGAAEHLKKYLELDANAPDAAAVRLQIQDLGKAVAAPALAADRDLPPAGEAWVPGGLKAFAIMAHLEHTPSYRDFYREYCRAILRETSIWNILPIPRYTETLQAYMSAVADLTALGEPHGDGATVTISLFDEASRRKAEPILGLLGWKIAPTEDGFIIEPGDRPTDASHQQIPAALGIDEIGMQETLEAGRSYRFEVPSEKANLMGGAAWTAMVKDVRPYPGGIADVFSRDWRAAKAYAGLSAMSPDAAAAVVKGVGLQNLAVLYSEEIAQDGESFHASNGIVTVPGGAEAEAAWTKLAGANPHDPPAFFRALLEKDHGTLAAFYLALYGADTPRQRFFLNSAARAERWYAWYRASGEIHEGQDRKIGTWHASFLQNLPLDNSGHVRYPGAKSAWISPGASDDALVGLRTLEALIAVGQLEEKRKVPLDEESARLLAEHYADWRSLFPYFESLPGLNGPDFEALAAFSGKVTGYRLAQRNAVLGEWHSLVELLALGTKSGALDAAKGAQFFRQACAQLSAPDHTSKSLALLHSMSGATDPDDSVPQHLLRLSGVRLAAFDRVRELQAAPKLASLGASPESAKAVAALSGLVYAALLDPDDLLLSEDPQLLRRHRFAEDSAGRPAPLFLPSELTPSSAPPGSYLSGGFGTLPEVARMFARDGGKPAERSVTLTDAITVPAAPGSVDSGPNATETVFHVNARLVEVHATVTDSHGHYVDDLPAGEFTILESGKPVPVVAFEGRASSVSVALLFDTTGSMRDSLPALRSAALKLIGELRPIDSAAVYSFADTVTELQSFTRDKSAAKRAVLRTAAAGATALYDALVRVNRDLAARSGKKVIVVFTDGADNLSVLTTKIAIERAQSSGIPIYTIAQGEALKMPALLKDLTLVSKTTGGVSFTIQNPNDIRKVFESVSQDLMHGYLLAFQPPAIEAHVWRNIEVTLKGAKGRSVRARDGYYPE